MPKLAPIWIHKRIFVANIIESLHHLRGGDESNGIQCIVISDDILSGGTAFDVSGKGDHEFLIKFEFNLPPIRFTFSP